MGSVTLHWPIMAAGGVGVTLDIAGDTQAERLDYTAPVDFRTEINSVVRHTGESLCDMRWGAFVPLALALVGSSAAAAVVLAAALAVAVVTVTATVDGAATCSKASGSRMFGGGSVRR